MIGASRWLESRLDLTLTLVQYLPPAVVVPVVLLFFGKSDATVLTVIAFGAFWPILLNTIDGVRGVDPLLVEVARLYRLRAIEIAGKVILPMALPPREECIDVDSMSRSKRILRWIVPSIATAAALATSTAWIMIDEPSHRRAIALLVSVGDGAGRQVREG